MIEIYIYGCVCGVNGALYRKVKRYALYNHLLVKLHQSKYSEKILSKHIQLLKDNNLKAHSYPALVLYEDQVTLLREWNF